MEVEPSHTPHDPSFDINAAILTLALVTIVVFGGRTVTQTSLKIDLERCPIGSWTNRKLGLLPVSKRPSQARERREIRETLPLACFGWAD